MINDRLGGGREQVPEGTGFREMVTEQPALGKGDQKGLFFGKEMGRWGRRRS
jgi:hypothetical protein